MEAHGLCLQEAIEGLQRVSINRDLFDDFTSSIMELASAASAAGEAWAKESAIIQRNIAKAKERQQKDCMQHHKWAVRNYRK